MSKGLKYTFLVHAISGLVFGLGLLFVPEQFNKMVNWTPIDPGMTRMLGVAFLAICASSWLAFRASEWQQVRIVVRMENVLTGVGFLTYLYMVLFADAPSFTWSSVAMAAVFGVLFGYFGRGPNQAKK
jgi:hypothetical protein